MYTKMSNLQRRQSTMNSLLTSVRPIHIVTALFIIVLFCNTTYMAATSPLDEDELRILHQGCEFALGNVVFQDFTTFPYTAYAALSSWGFLVTGNRFEAILFDRAVAVLFYLSSCLLLYALVTLIFSRRIAIYSLFAWMSLGYVLLVSYEARPIHPTLFFSLASAFFYFRFKKDGTSRGLRFFFAGTSAAIAFIFKADSAVLYGTIVLIELGSRLRRLNRDWLKDCFLLCAGPLLVISLYLASFADINRIYRYFFFQHVLGFYGNFFPESIWQWSRVIRFDLVIPFSIAALSGLYCTVTKRCVPRRRIIMLTWLATFGALSIISTLLRPLFYHQNLYFPSVVPALLAGAGLDFLLRLNKKHSTIAAWILILGMAVSAAGWQSWNYRDEKRNKENCPESFERIFSTMDDRTISVKEMIADKDAFIIDNPDYRLTLREHQGLFDFLTSIDGDHLDAYDGFEAATPIHGAAYLNGFVLGTFQDIKFQRIYEFVRNSNGFFIQRLRETGWRLFHNMDPLDAQEALIGELIYRPPSILIMDPLIFKLAIRSPQYADFLDRNYLFHVLKKAHSIVGVHKEKGHLLHPSSE